MTDDVVNITLGGNEYPIPLLPLGVRKKLWPISIRMRSIDQKNPTEENLDDIISVIVIGISFATKDFTREKLEAMFLDMSDLSKAVTAISSQTNGPQQEKGPAEIMGETQAGTENSAGTTS